MRLRLFKKSGIAGAKNEDGAAAIEFALLLPVMITLFFGVVESTLALVARADISIMSSTAADLISQESTTNTADITNIYNAANTILYPYYTGGSSGKPTIRLTSVAYDSGNAAPTMGGKVVWTCTQAGNGTLSPASRTVGQTVTFTQPLMVANGSVIMAEVAYGYSSNSTKVITGTINMTNNFYTKPRRVTQIPTPVGGCP